jgi:hypothetical protein
MHASDLFDEMPCLVVADSVISKATTMQGHGGLKSITKE